MIKSYTPATVPDLRQCTVCFYIKVGIVIFPQPTMIKFDLRRGERVKMHHDKTENKWFFEFDSNDGFALYYINGVRLGFASVHLLREFFKTMTLEKTSAKFEIAREPKEVETKLWYELKIAG